ncbi:YkgJ family cysteine cluster protein [Paenibacillus odorifer]|uniref:YkgJ family cysteine cluster protein n=1 Tax=Paenibacillus odorifer TaxID=189426 RepID=UPI00096CC7E2|nr:YkgJ family cysteine cluster protein [Paenibacillus odorifer]OMD71855.1 hypothetical protein BSK50_25530 [Paenibacillus odorifer]
MALSPKKLERFKREIKKGRKTYAQENKLEWLKALLDSYHYSDVGTRIELESQFKTNNKILACGEGCSNCCQNTQVPINEIELMGLSWYVSEEMDSETFQRITPQLINHLETTACPFLLDGRCSVYEVRPIACRVFNVFGKKCEEREDISFSRPEDIAHTHDVDIAWMVSQKLMPFMGVTDKKQQRYLFEDGFMMRKTRALHTFDWNVFKEQVDQIKSTL